MRRIKAVAFDLEGTVVDVEAVHHQAHILSAKDVGLTLTLDYCLKHLPYFISGPDGKIAEKIAGLARQRGIIVNQQGMVMDAKYIGERKKYHYATLLPTVKIKPRDGFVAFFQTIKGLGLKYAIGSLTAEDQARILLDKSGVGALFGYENIVLKEHVKNLKPAPDVWIKTAKRTGVEPAEQIVFEDSPRGIQGAMTIGAYCVGMPVYDRPDAINALVQAGAKRVFMSWNEINAVALIENANREWRLLINSQF